MFKKVAERRYRFEFWGFILAIALGCPVVRGLAAGLRTGSQSASPTAAQAGNAEDPPAETVFKNIQALKGMPASQMRDVMGLIATSLGMRCDQCHVPEAFEKDDKRPKQTARQMIRMTMAINRDNFEGQPQISCYSCHGGHERPTAIPPIAMAEAQPPAPVPRPVTSNLPTFDQIVDKYLQAVGGAASFDKLNSRIMKGTMTNARGDSYPVESVQTSKGKMLLTTTMPDRKTVQGFNGTVGWLNGPEGTLEVKGTELALLRRAADIARPLKIREEALSPRVLGKVNVENKEAYLVTGRADGQRVQLYFDVESGLLLRRVVMRGTVLGAYPEQIDLDDYREVDGVKLPFVTRTSFPNAMARSTIEWKEITHNAPVDDASFNPPSVQK